MTPTTIEMTIAHELARLTDSQPPAEAVAAVVLCAWCVDFNPRDPRNRGASHGICPTCFSRMEREL
jgi:hypothetical protein